MSYAPKRPHISKATRALILERDGGRCYLCGEPIVGEDFDADHELARELGGSDDPSNLRPAHRLCHRKKTKSDVKLIAKSNRVRRKHGPVELRKAKKPIPQPAKPNWPTGQKIASRGFPKRPRA